MTHTITQEEAQELLEVLEIILSAAGFEPYPDEHGKALERRAEAAVAKAKGEQL
jgi:hypothetical protein